MKTAWYNRMVADFFTDDGTVAHHVSERLAEYGRKPHRDLLAQQTISRASTHWRMFETQRGTASSNSRFQAVLLQQCSANISVSLSLSIHVCIYVYIYIYNA